MRMGSIHVGRTVALSYPATSAWSVSPGLFKAGGVSTSTEGLGLGEATVQDGRVAPG